MKKLFIMAGLLLALYACSNSGKTENGNASGESSNTPSADAPAAASGGSSDKGIGKFTDVKIDPALNQDMATKGLNVYDVKCSACHKLTDEKLVGPGWKGVTSRHTPEWVMNFTTNVDEMLTKDPKAQAQLEICLVRMPNQNLTDDDARNVYEFMRKNDGIK
jgi:mono/diheme cytochrome c family protein